MLRYKQPRNIKKVFTAFVNKIFSLNSQWVNTDVEVISLSDDNSPKAYEQYPWDNENYPIVVLFSEGTTDDRWSIDARVADVRAEYKLGNIARTYDTLGQYPIAGRIVPTLSSLKLQSVDLLVKNIGPYEEPIYVDIRSDTGNVPDQILASGSIKGIKTTGIEWLSTNIKPHITLVKDTPYYLTAYAPSGSYYWFIDNNIPAGITPSGSKGTYDGVTWTMETDETPIAKIYSPTMRRLGGGLNSTIRLFVEAKDLSTVQKISDLLFVYLHLVKHSNVGRSVKLSYPSSMSTDFDFVSNLSDEGIYIIDVNKGSETVRARGNDRLFSLDLTVSCYTSWTEDFELPTLEDVQIDPDIESVQIVLNKYT